MFNSVDTKIILPDGGASRNIHHMINICNNFRTVFKVYTLKAYSKIFFCWFKSCYSFYACMESNTFYASFLLDCFLIFVLIFIYHIKFP